MCSVVRRVLGFLLAVAALAPRSALALDDPAPRLADEALVATAEAQLARVVTTLDASQATGVRGIYVAIDPSPTDLLAMPACDDDGDYVVVVSMALLDLVRHVAVADASDRLRGTRLLDAYGTLLATSQRRDARPLPPPLRPGPGGDGDRSFADTLADAELALTGAFVDDALAWLVADELARAVLGDVVCPRPTVTREYGDDVWTPAERATALASAASRLPPEHASAADAWATAHLLARAPAGSEVPVVALLRVLAALEDARPRGEAATYLTHHPGSHERADAVAVSAWAWREDRRGGSSANGLAEARR